MGKANAHTGREGAKGRARVLHVISTLEMGGAEKLLTQLAPGLRDRGLDVEVAVLTRAEGALLESLQSQGITVRRLSRRAAVYSPLHIWRLRRLMRRYDVVHTHNTAPQLFAALAAIGLRHRPMLVTTEHNTSNRRRSWRWYLPADRWMYRRYRGIICISQRAEDNLRQYLRTPDDGRILTINNGIDLAQYAPAPATDASDDRVRIIMVAAFRWEKDQPTLIRAMARLPERYHLYLVGKGNRQAECEGLARQLGVGARVHMLGQRGDVPRLLAESDIVVMSSHFEGLSLSSVEGMASGKPFVASDVDGLREVARDAGLLFPHEDDRTLAEVLGRLGDDPAYAASVADRCRRRAAQYDIRTTIDAYAALYRRMLDK